MIANGVNPVMTVPERQTSILRQSSTTLYANEINASISSVWDGGFYAVLGNPKIAEASSLPTICDAVLWLWEAAC
jgi:hypothetical protein